MQRTHTPTQSSRTQPARRILAGLSAAALVLAACGGSDDDSGSGDSADEVVDDVDTDSGSDAGSGGDGDGVLADNDVRDAFLEGEDGEEFEDAIGGLSAETRYDIVAGQLEPEPSVEIDGDNIRLVFPSGSVSDALINCIVASVTQLDAETLTLVYPDGEEVC